MRASSAKLAIRQDRHIIEDSRCCLVVDGKKYDVVNFSTFGVAIKSEQGLQLGWAGSGSIRIGDIEISTIPLKVVRSEEKNGVCEVAFEANAPIDTDRAEIVSKALRSLLEVQNEATKEEMLPQSYKYFVFNLKNVLEKIKRNMEGFAKAKFDSAAEKAVFEQAIIDVFSQSIYDVIRDCNSKLSEIIDREPNVVFDQAVEYFREQLQSFGRQDTTQSQLFGLCLEKAVQMHSIPGTLKNRSKYLVERILGCLEIFYPQNIKVLSFGSGPAFEVRSVIEELSSEDCERVEFVLLDEDLVSLKSAQKNILTVAKRSGKKVNVELLHCPDIQLLEEHLSDVKFDLIYSAGLFDGFSDDLAGKVGQTLFQYLAEEGRLIVCNYALSSPNSFSIMTLLDSKLPLRSQADLQRIFDIEGAKRSYEIEPEGISLFTVVQRK